MNFQQLFGELRSAKEANDTMRVVSAAYKMQALSEVEYYNQAQHIVEQYMQGHSMLNSYTIQRLESIKKWSRCLCDFKNKKINTGLIELATNGSVDALIEALGSNHGWHSDEEITKLNYLYNEMKLLLRTDHVETPSKYTHTASYDIRDVVWHVLKEREHELEQEQKDSQ